ncbi:MAG: hypothetical protein Q7S88_00425 [Candidatus Daviesbacteria bacterium]|nr:hypothetical protein [Candidatus Daviesbacteria bacterium]
MQPRTNQWLLSRLDHLWNAHFSDIKQINPVFISFGRSARLRFGSIRLDPRSGKTIITITGMFKNESIPQSVVDHTIGHELCHYTHGFSSPHRRLHKYPHSGGVIKKEMTERGMLDLYKAYKEWLKVYREELKDYYRNRR